LSHHSTPAVAYNARPKASPNSEPDSDYRVRHDRVDKAGKVTLRLNGRLFHIGTSRTLSGTPVIMLIHDPEIRIIHAATGEILRHLTINPDHSYHGTGKPPGPPRKPQRPAP